MMRVLVTGATGFIGTHVVDELLGAGHQVRVLARASSNTTCLPAAVEVVRGELAEAPAAVADLDGVVHLAGIGGAFVRSEDLRAVNVEGTRQVFGAAAAAGVRRGVLVTSMWTLLRPELAAQSPYVASRLESEEAALATAGRRMEIVILCPTYVVGRGDRGPNFPGALILSIVRRRLPFVPPGGMTWIGARDVARTVVAALGRGRGGARYLVGAEHLSNADLVAEVARQAGVRPPWITPPRRLLRLGAALGDAALAVVRQRPAVPLAAGIDMLGVENPLDCTPSWGALAAPTVPVRVAIGEAIAWFRQAGYAKPA